MRPRLSIQTGQQFAAWPDIVRIWQEAERLGYDGAYAYDHFMAVMLDPFDPCLEAWTALAALAVHTIRLRLGVLVTGNTYRHPAVLAKMATTVDVISNGRLDFGNISRRAPICPSIPPRRLDAVAAELNARPRQTLNWLTPSEAFAQIVAMTA